MALLVVPSMIGDFIVVNHAFALPQLRLDICSTVRIEAHPTCHRNYRSMAEEGHGLSLEEL